MRVNAFRLGFAVGLVCCGIGIAGLFFLSGPSDAAHTPTAHVDDSPPRITPPRADVEIQLVLNVVDEVSVGSQEDLAATLRMGMVENLFIHALSDSGLVVRSHESCKGNSAVKLSYFVNVYPASPDRVYFQLTRMLDGPNIHDMSFDVRGPATIARLKEDLYSDASRWAGVCADAIATRDHSHVHVGSPASPSLANAVE